MIGIWGIRVGMLGMRVGMWEWEWECGECRKCGEWGRNVGNQGGNVGNQGRNMGNLGGKTGNIIEYKLKKRKKVCKIQFSQRPIQKIIF